MKLHLPKGLLAFAMLACFACGSASALSVTANFAGTTTTHDTSANFTGTGYSYDASTGVITYNGGFGKFEATITLDYDAFAALTANTDLLTITADKGTWGLLATDSDTIIGRGTNQNYPTGSISADTLRGYATGEGTSQVIADMSLSIDGTTANTGTQLKTSANQDVYVNTGLRYTPAIISSAKLDKNLITSITLKDVGSYTVSNASKTWTKNYNDSTKVSFNSVASSAKDATILDKAVLTVNPDGIGNGNAVDLSANGGDIIIGGSGQLFLQTWVSATEGGDISLGNDIYLGATTQTTGAIRFGAYSGDITLNGAVTLVEDAKITKEPDLGNDNQVTISRKVSGDYTLTLDADTGDKVDDISFAGGMDVSGLTIAKASELTFAQQTDIDTLNLQAGAAHSLAFNGATTIGTLTMSDDSTLNISGSGAVSIGGGALSGTITYSGSNTVTLNGNVTIAEVTDLQTGDGVRYSENNGEDGYISSAEFIVIEGTGESSAAALGTSGLKLNNTYDLAVSTNGKNVVAYVDEENPAGVYYVNTTVNYGGEGGSSQIVADTTTGITMNGGTLNLNTELANGVNISTLKTGSTINLAADVTLDNSAVTPGEVKSTLTGVAATDSTAASVYNMGQVSMNGGNNPANNETKLNVEIGDNWRGTIVFDQGSSFQYFAFDLNDFGCAGSTIQFNGVADGSYLGQGSNQKATYAANIDLQGNGFKIENGFSGTEYTFTGAFSGSGSFTMNKGNLEGQAYIFSGDMSKWTGELKQNQAAKSGYTYSYTFNQKATNIANKVTAAAGTMVVNVDNSAAVSMTGDITAEGGELQLTKTGGSKLSVTNMAAKTSNIVLSGTGENAIEVGTLSIASGKSVSGAADVTVTTKLAVAAENALVLTGALTMGDNATIDLTGLTINEGQTSYTLATATGGVTGSISMENITGLVLTGTAYEGWSYSIAAQANPQTRSASETALVLTLTKDADPLTTLNVTGVDVSKSSDTVLTLTTAQNATDAVFGNALNAVMDDATWADIKAALKGANITLDDSIAVTFVGADGKTFDFGDNGETQMAITINGEVTRDDNLVATKPILSGDGAAAGTIVGNYVTAYIPEPTSTTLSLLALAALAVRRRRR